MISILASVNFSDLKAFQRYFNSGLLGVLSVGRKICLPGTVDKTSRQEAEVGAIDIDSSFSKLFGSQGVSALF